MIGRVLFQVKTGDSFRPEMVVGLTPGARRAAVSMLIGIASISVVLLSGQGHKPQLLTKSR